MESHIRPDDSRYISEQELFRLRTYKNWPVKFMNPTKLAQAGFFYLGEGDQVRCSFCYLVLNQWEEGDDPMEDHKKWSKNCPFLKCKNIQNTFDSITVPRMESHNHGFPHHGEPKYPNIGVKPSDELTRLQTFQNWPISHVVKPEELATAGFFYLKNNFNSVQCNYCNGIIEDWNVGDDPDREHVKRFPWCLFVKHIILPRLQMLEPIVSMDVDQIDVDMNYTTLESRIESFSSFSQDLQATAELFAEAGFYYSGRGKEVVCFSCSVGLRNWEPTDDPWIEHAKYRGTCNYLLETIGVEFVEDILQNTMANGFEVTESTQTNAQNNEKDRLNDLTNKILKKKIRKLEKLLMCKVCMDNEVEIVFLPCKHLVVCPTCAVNLNDCPVCRISKTDFVKIYFS